MDDDELSCIVCGGPAESQCSRCKAAWYCGQECQRADWKKHKVTCKKASSSSEAAVPSPARSTKSADGSFTTCPVANGVLKKGKVDESKPPRLAPGRPAPIDLVLVGRNNMDCARSILEKLKERGVCVLKAGAEPAMLRQALVECNLLWDTRKFGEATKAMAVQGTGGEEVEYSSRDDKVAWFTEEFLRKNEKATRTLKALNDHLGDFGMGMARLLEEELGLEIEKRTCGMLSCYTQEVCEGPRYDFHIDNPYQTLMECKDDKRRLTIVYYMNDGAWDVQHDGGGLQCLLTDPRRAPKTTSEALASPELTISPTADTLVVFFAHTIMHAVLPVTSNKRRFALSCWFQCP